ncbi:MAG: polysaccharide deacetylase, partial [bacterium]|nr:polysaccharide deacetylase [bacterium]
KLSGTVPSLLIHPLDFLGSDDEPELGFFPGMDIEAAKKADVMQELLDMWDEQYKTLPIGDYVTRLSGLKTRVPDLMKAT